MIELFHGSNVLVKDIDLSIGRENVDFGKGFYLTTLREQAEKWATTIANIKGGTPTVSTFAFDQSDQLYIKRFNGYSVEWLEFVVANRRQEKNHFSHPYDVIYGNIADDKVMPTIDNFIEAIIDDRVTESFIKTTLEELSYQKQNDQYCFVTPRATEHLKFIK